MSADSGSSKWLNILQATAVEAPLRIGNSETIELPCTQNNISTGFPSGRKPTEGASSDEEQFQLNGKPEHENTTRLVDAPRVNDEARLNICWQYRPKGPVDRRISGRSEQERARIERQRQKEKEKQAERARREWEQREKERLDMERRAERARIQTSRWK